MADATFNPLLATTVAADTAGGVGSLLAGSQNSITNSLTQGNAQRTAFLNPYLNTLSQGYGQQATNNFSNIAPQVSLTNMLANPYTQSGINSLFNNAGNFANNQQTGSILGNLLTSAGNVSQNLGVLTPTETRQVTQQSRAAFSDRGLANSTGSVLDELNRLAQGSELKRAGQLEYIGGVLGQFNDNAAVQQGLYKDATAASQARDAQSNDISANLALANSAPGQSILAGLANSGIAENINASDLFNQLQTEYGSLLAQSTFQQAQLDTQKEIAQIQARASENIARAQSDAQVREAEIARDREIATTQEAGRVKQIEALLQEYSTAQSTMARYSGAYGNYTQSLSQGPLARQQASSAAAPYIQAQNRANEIKNLLNNLGYQF